MSQRDSGYERKERDLYMAYDWKDIEELRAAETKPSGEPIKTNDLEWVDGELCQRVVMRGGVGNSYWVRIPGNQWSAGGEHGKGYREHLQRLERHHSTR